MKKYIVALLVFACIIVMAGCSAKEPVGDPPEANGQDYFNAEVVEVLDNRVSVRCLDITTGAITEGTELSMTTKVSSANEVPEMEVGDHIRVVFSGVMETDPPRLQTVFSCYTNNVENYGVYNAYDEEWKPELFPEEITDGMTPIYYSYYHDMSWDGIVEIYLEVEMTDSSYNELKSQYKGQLTECWYAEGYSEYARNDSLDADENYCGYAYVKKIIFNDSDKTVIFEYLDASDPVHFENIYYLERFNIDGKEYSDYLEAQNESN